MAWLQEQARAAAGSAGRALPAEPSLLRAIIASYGRPYFLLGLLKAAGDALNFAGPLLLNLLLRHLAARGGSSHGSGGSGSSSGSDVASGDALRLLGWQADVGAPAFGYACAALLAGSLVLKVRAWCACHACSSTLRPCGQCVPAICYLPACLPLTCLPGMCLCRLCWAHSTDTARLSSAASCAQQSRQLFSERRWPLMPPRWWRPAAGGCRWVWSMGAADTVRLAQAASGMPCTFVGAAATFVIPALQITAYCTNLGPFHPTPTSTRRLSGAGGQAVHPLICLRKPPATDCEHAIEVHHKSAAGHRHNVRAPPPP
jgi:hypothetical protein